MIQQNRMMEQLSEGRQQHYDRVRQLRKQIYAAHQLAKEELSTLQIDRTHTIKDDKLQMVFHLRLALNKKDQAASHANPFLNPSKQLLITDLGSTHRLLFNKFNIYANHLLVVTTEFESQKEKISNGDMVNAGLVCEALEGIIFFNGGELSGASQPHKHLQLLPKQAKELPIVRAIHEWVQSKPKIGKNKIERFDGFNFIHGIVAIVNSQPFEPLGELLYQGYLALYDELIVKNKQKHPQISDYNIVACDSFILMAVRKKEKAFDKVSINSLGYMGSVLFKKQEVMQEFIKTYSPSQILSDISWQQ